ncbi:MAG: hypothetical protein IJF44_02800 [Clostridia bacterium]|nr:hypothetical protein [Clostridia bacterium]
MSVDKVILKAFLSTLGAALALMFFLIGGISLFFPQSMMKITYNLGMEETAVFFAEVSYSRTDEVYYIAYATEVAIQDDNQEKVIECGQQFIADKKFDSYCKEKNKGVEKDVAGYDQYIYGRVCMAKYESGDKEGAVALAFEGIGKTFPKNNAVAAVLIQAKKLKDNATVASIKEKMEQLQTELEGDTTYFDEILELINS